MKRWRLSGLDRLPSASTPAALGSLGALAAQALLALFLLRSFEAGAAGTFSVLSQLAFFWATLALAQSPVSLLAERGLEACAAARRVWRQSLARWLMLLPLVVAALWWSSDPSADAAGARGMAWLVTLSLAQMGWYLAQSLVLRTRSDHAVAAVRMTPAVLAVVLAALALWGLGASDAGTLLTCASLGFAAGALWLLPAWTQTPANTEQAAAPHTPASTAPSPPPSERSADPRPTWLKALHTFSDVGALTWLAVHWQAQHGSAATGQLLVLLRLTGFVPALVHTAWAQVALARSLDHPGLAKQITGAAGLLLVMMAAAVAVADHLDWLGPGWQGLSALLLPVLAWQTGAVLLASLAHRPFQTGRASAWSWGNIALNGGLVALVSAPTLPALAHLQWVGYGAAAGHLWLWLWLRRLRG